MKHHRLFPWPEIIAALLLALMMMCSCRAPRVTTRTVSDTVYLSALRRDTVYLSALRADTLLRRDSVHEGLILRGDTIVITQYREHVTYRDRLRTDTVYKTRIQYDTLYHTARDTLLVEKEGGKAKNGSGGWRTAFWLALAAAAAAWIYKREKG